MDYFATATDASSSSRAMEENAEVFLHKLNSSNSVGCVDGKHIPVPKTSDSIFYTSKQFFFFFFLAGCM